MTAKVRSHFDKVFRRLEKLGLLLLSGPTFPSVVDLIAKDVVKGSWWSHHDAHTIFAVSELLEAHPDVLIVKLIDGKVTFVHRELWSQIYSIGVAREDWQLRNLSQGSRILLKIVDDEGALQTNKLDKAFGPKPGEFARELEQTLLIHAQQVHTETGAHAKRLERWDVWAKRARFRCKPKSPSRARDYLERRLAEVNHNFDPKGRLPWSTTL